MLGHWDGSRLKHKEQKWVWATSVAGGRCAGLLLTGLLAQVLTSHGSEAGTGHPTGQLPVKGHPPGWGLFVQVLGLHVWGCWEQTLCSQQRGVF